MAPLTPEIPTVAAPAFCRGLAVLLAEANPRGVVERAGARLRGERVISPAKAIVLNPDGGLATLSNRARSATDPATARRSVLAAAARRPGSGT